MATKADEEFFKANRDHFMRINSYGPAFPGDTRKMCVCGCCCYPGAGQRYHRHHELDRALENYSSLRLVRSLIFPKKQTPQHIAECKRELWLRFKMRILFIKDWKRLC